MAEPIRLADSRPLVNQDAIDKLEALLLRVRSGEVTSVASAYTMRGGWVGQGYSESENSTLLLGSIGILHNRLASHLDLSSEDAPDPPADG